jgi:ABC-type multidrug transport system permease subunit
MTSTDSIKSLIDKSKDYLDTKIELTKLKTIDKSADILSSVIVLISMILISFLLILFISIAVAMMVGRALGGFEYGFFIIGGLYAVLLLMIYIQREKWIKTPIANGLINKMLK